MRISLTWDEDRVQKLKKLWNEGLSVSVIAGQLGGVTRNAVIGKVHRLKLAGRATTKRKPIVRRVPNYAPKRLPAPKARKSAWQRHLESQPVNVEPTVETPIPLHQRRTIETLEAHDCRWPIGDPQEADFHFCGAKKIDGLPYCECHARRAFSQPTGVAAPHFTGSRSRFTGALLRRLTNSVNLLEDA